MVKVTFTCGQSNLTNTIQCKEGNQVTQKRYIPWITYLNLAICVLVYAIEAYLSHSLTINSNVILHMGAEISRGKGGSLGQFIGSNLFNWQNWCATWLHFSFMHIAENMIFLLLVGTMIEKFYGHLRFLLLYVLTGFLGNVTQATLQPHSVSAGASTALFGIMIAGYVLKHTMKSVQGVNMVAYQISNQLIGLFVLNIILDIGQNNPAASTQIAILGHLGGALAGLFLGYALRPRLYGPDGKQLMRTNIWVECGIAMVMLGLLLTLVYYI